jgi:hypothetical protein
MSLKTGLVLMAGAFRIVFNGLFPSSVERTLMHPNSMELDCPTVCRGGLGTHPLVFVRFDDVASAGDLRLRFTIARLL